MSLIDRARARLGLDGPLAADAATLVALHRAHAETIPFENFDVLLGRPPSLDPEALAAKMLDRRRGGYCFEHNSLLRAVLAGLGFAVRPLLGCVTFNLPGIRPRTHLLTLVEAGGRRWIADVGFGGHGLVEPVPFEPGREHDAIDGRYRIRPSFDEGYEMEVWRDGGWLSLYWFDLAHFRPLDIEVANWFTATHPASPFRARRIASLPGRARRLNLTDAELTIREGDRVAVRRIATESEFRLLMAGDFGLDLPEAALPPLDGLARDAA
ncbi:MAG TPA: arylamine N-acetyltransferase [Alphaproteobacteria bacterium]|nr:arylamine N-acetyltransferase [Alphaproteobacteria bacterium]